MARVITLSKLAAGRILITKESGEDPIVTLEYTLTDSNGGHPIQVSVQPPLNGTRATQVSQLWDAALAYVRQLEGITG